MLLMPRSYRFSIFLIATIVTAGAAFAQGPNVVGVTSGEPLIISSEGLADRVGEIVYDCSGQPGTPVTANLTISLNVNITNRLSTGNTLTGIVFTIDTGAGPQAVPVQPVLVSPGLLTYNGVKFTLSAAGTAA